MNRPDIAAKEGYQSIVENRATIVTIPGTKKTYKLRWIKPYTMERITRVWIERDLASARLEDGADVLKDLAKEPYFAFKEAALMILNHDIKIRLFYGILWRHLARKYSENQIAPLIAEGKKKLPLMAHYENMVYLMGMRTDMVKMTKMEAEQYQAERLSVAKQLSSKSSPLMGVLVGALDGGKETSGTGAS